MRLMSRGNNVQRLDLVAMICSLYNNHVLLMISSVILKRKSGQCIFVHKQNIFGTTPYQGGVSYVEMTSHLPTGLVNPCCFIDRTDHCIIKKQNTVH